MCCFQILLRDRNLGPLSNYLAARSGAVVWRLPRFLLHVEQSEVPAAIVLFMVILVSENLVTLCFCGRNCSLRSAFSFFTASISSFILSIPFSISKHLEPNLSILSLIFFSNSLSTSSFSSRISCPSQRFKLSFVFLNVSWMARVSSPCSSWNESDSSWYVLLLFCLIAGLESLSDDAEGACFRFGVDLFRHFVVLLLLLAFFHLPRIKHSC